MVTIYLNYPDGKSTSFDVNTDDFELSLMIARATLKESKAESAKLYNREGVYLCTYTERG